MITRILVIFLHSQINRARGKFMAIIIIIIIIIIINFLLSEAMIEHNNQGLGLGWGRSLLIWWIKPFLGCEVFQAMWSWASLWFGCCPGSFGCIYPSYSLQVAGLISALALLWYSFRKSVRSHLDSFVTFTDRGVSVRLLLLLVFFFSWWNTCNFMWFS